MRSPILAFQVVENWGYSGVLTQSVFRLNELRDFDLVGTAALKIHLSLRDAVSELGINRGFLHEALVGRTEVVRGILH